MKNPLIRKFISAIISLKLPSRWHFITLAITTCVLLAASMPGYAATIRVNNTADNQNSGDGVCTLREAIDNANTDSDTTLGDCRAGAGADKVRLLQSGPPDYVLSLGQLTLSDDVTVVGNSSLSVIDAAGSSRVFQISGAIAVKFSKVTIRGGSSFDGGGINVPVGANVTISNSVMTGNTASGLGGGAILNRGGMTIKNTSITDNATSIGGGAGIRNEGGTMYISVSDISDNHSSPSFAGGGILNFVGGHMVIHNSTIALNSSSVGHGGGVENNAFLAIANSEFDSNSVGQNGGAIRNTPSSYLFIRNSTFTGNTAGSNGGGIYNHPGSGGTANLIIQKSNFSGNMASGDGGGVFNGAILSIVNKSTLTMNTANNSGGGVFNSGQFVFLDSDNSGNSPDDCAGTCP